MQLTLIETDTKRVIVLVVVVWVQILLYVLGLQKDRYLVVEVKQVYVESSFCCIVLVACCLSSNTESSSLTKQRLSDAHAKGIDPVSKERMPSVLPGERTDKVEGSDKAVIAGNCQSITTETVVFLLRRQNFSPQQQIQQQMCRSCKMVTFNRVNSSGKSNEVLFLRYCT